MRHSGTLATLIGLVPLLLPSVYAVPSPTEDQSLEATLTKRQSSSVANAIAYISWFKAPNCDFTQDSAELFVSETENTPDNCDPGTPLYNNAGDELYSLPWAPASFVVNAQPSACQTNTTNGIPQYLSKVQLFACIAQPDPNNWNSICHCDPETWAHADGYGICVNTPEFAAKGGGSYAIFNNRLTCADGQVN